MTKKYLILPQNGGDKFRQLLASMPGTAQEQKIMQEATIKHVEIDVNNNSWEILMQTYNGIPDENMEEYFNKAQAIKIANAFLQNQRNKINYFH